MIQASDARSNPAVQAILDSFGLTPEQRRAAAARRRDVLVTAGAGSGKTRTLVARYLSLLAEDSAPRRVAAITFTEKAAREMRSRVRAALLEQVALAGSAGESQRWRGLEAQMDAARIGTIHSLCAEILRAHPAEAGVDPRFEVLDEGLAAALRAQAVADTLAWLAGESQFAPLLSGCKTSTLGKLLAFLLERRLEAGPAFETDSGAPGRLLQALQHSIDDPALAAPLDGLQDLHRQGRLLADAGEKLAQQVSDLLALWEQANRALQAGSYLAAASHLFTARRQAMGGRAGSKTSQAKALLAELKQAYDQRLDPWLGGKESKDQPPDEAVEVLFGQALPLLRQAFDHLQQTYQAALRQRQALDFDDLEAGAARLLARADVRRQWQAEIDALLVDEFQDTNARQRQIVQALCGETPGRLFVVGDARQSIYRFRRADVTVFADLQRAVLAGGGLVVDLDLTYRAHTPLLQAAGDLLKGVMGEQSDPQRPYVVPFAPLRSDHHQPRTAVQAPYLEFVLGAGEDAEAARPLAARALAQRLLELQRAGEIARWDDVALLLRASTGFPAFEQAFEDAGIPFVTVAGRGFYDRPEIRDVLNLLRALADPWDDLAMAGLLRSPAFGLSDAALYHLRWGSSQKQPYWLALQGDLDGLDEVDRRHAGRARQVLAELRPLVDRLPVAELLKRLVDRVDYRAILAAAPAAAGRLWRNLDKLLADARASELVSVRAFLAYLDTLREAGAREGEAPAEAQGAVRLMTIHKAKGLEFPLVVLADAARQPNKASEIAYLLPGIGLAFKFDQLETAPLAFRLARWQDSLQADAEEKRLLYVALTRAKEKLLISGHVSDTRQGSSWLKDLSQAAGVDPAAASESGQPLEALTPGGFALRLWGLPASAAAQAAEPPEAAAWPDSAAPALYAPLLPPEPESADPEPGEAPHPWRATGERRRPPAEALGLLVHRLIQRWLFPAGTDQRSSPALPRLLQTAALQAGLADPAQRAEAVRLAELLLGRLRHHALWQEIDGAAERYHEVPYTRFTHSERLDSGYIDLLYRRQDGWQVVDFKTDSLRSPAERQAAVQQYRPQLLRYAQAAQALLGQPVRTRLCFLDDQGQLSLEEI